MRNKLILILAICALGMVGCSKETDTSSVATASNSAQEQIETPATSMAPEATQPDGQAPAVGVTNDMANQVTPPEAAPDQSMGTDGNTMNAQPQEMPVSPSVTDHPQADMGQMPQSQAMPEAPSDMSGMSGNAADSASSNEAPAPAAAQEVSPPSDMGTPPESQAQTDQNGYGAAPMPAQDNNLAPADSSQNENATDATGMKTGETITTEDANVTEDAANENDAAAATSDSNSSAPVDQD